VTSRTVRPSAAAQRDLLKARQWLTQRGAGATARQQLTAIGDAIRGLREHPTRWAFSLDHPGRRRRVVGEYVILYRVEPDTGNDKTAGDVLILRVFGPGQDQR